MIIAVPQQETVRSSGINIPEHESVLTWYRWWCSVCKVTADGYCSHPDSALGQGERHMRTAQCHVVGQLSLLPLVGAS